jgi:hypothetical protein
MTTLIEQEILVDVLTNHGDTFYESVLSDFLDEQGVEHDFRKPLHNNIVLDLKPYQEKCLDIWANHWIGIGFCTKPTDESKVKQCVFDLYKQLDLETPKSVIFVDNPIELFYQTYEKMDYQSNNEKRNQIYKLFWDQLYLQLYKQLNDKLWKRVLKKTSKQLLDLVYNLVSNNLLFKLYKNVYVIT